MSAIATALLATTLAVSGAVPLAAPPGGDAAATHQPGGLVDLGIDECAWDVNDRGTVLTTTHLVRGGRVLPLPGGLTSARFVNDRGQVAGEVDGRAAFWDGSRLWMVGALSPDHTLVYVTGLSERGELVGTSGAWGGEPAAFRWRHGVMTALEGLGGRTDANDVNDRGQVVGAAWVGDTQHAVRWEADGRLVRLAGLGDGSGSSLATAVDDRGRAAGYSYLSAGSGDVRPVRWSASGAVAEVGPQGGALGVVADLSDRGRVIGWVAPPGQAQQAFAQDAGGPVRFVDPAAGEVTLMAVNDAGHAVGCLFTDDGERAVLWR
ncbi:hypothetical protein [Cellulomonas oligotrophica]|uniref:Putative HAF family extracellular repeat protein n=1 Tax=Cellulomonas oligotrophica TaxID=931536 RepID=A0A7Y9FDQ6_9CELL|nr:hypothetical protein [Cellulomonas oligotrophica]NYD85405.1 putative HAF family extracellular repeat protein [Cellulomonas oligotrophica]GIG33160.1 hypothetical protein Col01nite_23190 [Cellulomonas oligotrophica]